MNRGMLNVFAVMYNRIKQGFGKKERSISFIKGKEKKAMIRRKKNKFVRKQRQILQRRGK